MKNSFPNFGNGNRRPVFPKMVGNGNSRSPLPGHDIDIDMVRDFSVFETTVSSSSNMSSKVCNVLKALLMMIIIFQTGNNPPGCDDISYIFEMTQFYAKCEKVRWGGN